MVTDADARRLAEEILGSLDDDGLNWSDAVEAGARIIAEAVAQALKERDRAIDVWKRTAETFKGMSERQAEEIESLAHTLSLWDKECGGQSPSELKAEIARLQREIDARTHARAPRP